MKRTVLVAAAAVVAFGSGYTGARTLASHNSPVATVADAGDACTTLDGRSGYMMSSGREWVCQAEGES